jgi:ABC-type transport system substrate-binding protein
LSLSLIVNVENQYRVAAAYQIADSLEEFGFKINLQILSFDEYSRRISAGEYDMYLGEVKLDGSMDISQFFTSGTPFSSGIDTNQRVATDYFKYRAGEITAAEYYETFVEYYPFIPIAFRTGYAVTSNDVTLNFERVPFSLYNGI